MTESQCLPGRRDFFRAATTVSAAAGVALLSESLIAADDGINVLGPKPGYSPQIGTLVSMLTWMQKAIPKPVQGLTQNDLDYLFDKNANTIGALLLHLAATETYYGLHTFEGKVWGSWPDSVKQQWDPAMQLGPLGREKIRGHDLDYYLRILRETREKTLSEFQKRDDQWLLSVDEKWGWGPTNNYCKWFHVCEHISHHVGQIAFLKTRLPGAKPAQE